MESLYYNSGVCTWSWYNQYKIVYQQYLNYIINLNKNQWGYKRSEPEQHRTKWNQTKHCTPNLCMEGHYFTLIHILGDGFFLFSSRSFQECAFWGVVGNTSESISWDDFCVISAKVIITHGLSQWSLFLFLHLGSQLEHRRISITCAELLRSLHILCLSKYWTHF